MTGSAVSQCDGFNRIGKRIIPLPCRFNVVPKMVEMINTEIIGSKNCSNKAVKIPHYSQEWRARQLLMGDPATLQYPMSEMRRHHMGAVG